MAYISGMVYLLNPSLALAIGAPARAMPANICKGNVMQVSTLSIRSIKANPAFSEYFGKLSISDLADAAFRKGASMENFAAGLSGALCEYLVSGSDHGVKALRALASSEAKGRAPKLCREALAYFEGFKPGKTVVTGMDEADSLLAGHHAEFLAILMPDNGKPKAKPINWRQECMNARAERDAALAEVAAWKETADKLAAKLEHAQALATATATATATA